MLEADRTAGGRHLVDSADGVVRQRDRDPDPGRDRPEGPRAASK
jgi:hypothetical protein